MDAVNKARVSNFILGFTSLGFTGWGIYLLIRGDITNGLLSLIVGELIDMPKRRDKTGVSGWNIKERILWRDK